MKKMELYQVFDNVGLSTITGVIPASNRLTACLGFRNTYILNKDPQKNPYQYKALDLIQVANLELNEDGLVVKANSAEWTISGGEVMKYIQDEMAARGVDDFILDDDEEKE